jgi:hypothetical protein
MTDKKIIEKMNNYSIEFEELNKKFKKLFKEAMIGSGILAIVAFAFLFTMLYTLWGFLFIIPLAMGIMKMCQMGTERDVIVAKMTKIAMEEKSLLNEVKDN